MYLAYLETPIDPVNIWKTGKRGKPLPKWSKWSGTKLQRQLSTSRRTCWLATLMCRWTSFDLWGGLIREWSFSQLYSLTEIDQITISNYRHSHSGSPSTRDWRLPGKLCQLNNNFCNQRQINFVQEDHSKKPWKHFVFNSSWSQGADGKPDYDNVSDLEYLDMVISPSSLKDIDKRIF